MNQKEIDEMSHDKLGEMLHINKQAQGEEQSRKVERRQRQNIIGPLLIQGWQSPRNMKQLNFLDFIRIVQNTVEGFRHKYLVKVIEECSLYHYQSFKFGDAIVAFFRTHANHG